MDSGTEAEPAVGTRPCDKRPKKSNRNITRQRLPWTVVRADLLERERDQILKSSSEAELGVKENQWRPLGWVARRVGKEDETKLRQWCCPFHRESGCQAKFREVVQRNGKCTLERGHWPHNEHRSSGRQAHG